ncbi:unnamed protein product [Symbiodinium sp. CCMP2456]|nr:unnamed protein product [Symbiodinium sp. CCMP2456]
MPASQLAPTSLGHVAVTRGSHAAVTARFEGLASKAWLTCKLSVLLPVDGLPKQAVDELVSALQLQRAAYLLEDVPLESLGHPWFVDVASERKICGLSVGPRGQSALALLGASAPPRLCAQLATPGFQRLGLEEPLPGAAKLQAKLLSGKRHVVVDLPISKTRARRAAKTKEPATSRWQSLTAPLGETISLQAYCDREMEPPYDFAPLQSASSRIHCQKVPVQHRLLRLGQTLRRPPFERLVLEPWQWSDPQDQAAKAAARFSASYGQACEDLLDWLGGLHLEIDIPEGDLGQVSNPGMDTEALLWTMGESLLGPSQIQHALQVCKSAFAKQAEWFLLSIWGAEDAPISHHGGAHGFDTTGAHHAHLLCVRGRSEEREDPRGLLIEGVNALDSAA